jgi:glycosyltransferase involved in cell wall biosynthesis
MQIKISVVIPTYKRPTLLINCLRALLKQTINNAEFEVIVVSDGPDKATLIALLPWLKTKPIKLTYLNTPTKKGPAAARNFGWKHAKAELIAFTDDDCIPDEQWLEVFLDNFHHPLPVAFSGKTIVPLPSDPTDFALNTANLENADFVTANCACSKLALLKTGGFDERFKLAWREDSDLHFKLLEQQIPIQKLTGAVVIHPVREASWGISIKEQKKGLYDALLYRKFPQLYRSKIEPVPHWNYYLINLLWVLLFISLFSDQNYLKFIILFTLIICLSTVVLKRLRHTSKSISHVFEMFSTSIVIPTLSVYWRIYGAVKYRTIFI